MFNENNIYEKDYDSYLKDMHKYFNEIYGDINDKDNSNTTNATIDLNEISSKFEQFEEKFIKILIELQKELFSKSFIEDNLSELTDLSTEINKLFNAANSVIEQRLSFIDNKNTDSNEIFQQLKQNINTFKSNLTKEYEINNKIVNFIIDRSKIDFDIEQNNSNISDIIKKANANINDYFKNNNDIKDIYDSLKKSLIDYNEQLTSRIKLYGNYKPLIIELKKFLNENKKLEYIDPNIGINNDDTYLKDIEDRLSSIKLIISEILDKLDQFKIDYEFNFFDDEIVNKIEVLDKEIKNIIYFMYFKKLKDLIDHNNLHVSKEIEKIIGIINNYFTNDNITNDDYKYVNNYLEEYITLKITLNKECSESLNKISIELIEKENLDNINQIIINLKDYIGKISEVNTFLNNTNNTIETFIFDLDDKTKTLEQNIKTIVYFIYYKKLKDLIKKGIVAPIDENSPSIVLYKSFFKSQIEDYNKIFYLVNEQDYNTIKKNINLYSINKQKNKELTENIDLVNKLAIKYKKLSTGEILDEKNIIEKFDKVFSSKVFKTVIKVNRNVESTIGQEINNIDNEFIDNYIDLNTLTNEFYQLINLRLKIYYPNDCLTQPYRYLGEILKKIDILNNNVGVKPINIIDDLVVNNNIIKQVEQILTYDPEHKYLFIGDVHGDIIPIISLIRTNNLINIDNEIKNEDIWKKLHFIFLGDVIDPFNGKNARITNHENYIVFNNIKTRLAISDMHLSMLFLLYLSFKGANIHYILGNHELNYAFSNKMFLQILYYKSIDKLDNFKFYSKLKFQVQDDKTYLIRHEPGFTYDLSYLFRISDNQLISNIYIENYQDAMIKYQNNQYAGDDDTGNFLIYQNPVSNDDYTTSTDNWTNRYKVSIIGSTSAYTNTYYTKVNIDGKDYKKYLLKDSRNSKLHFYHSEENDIVPFYLKEGSYDKYYLILDVIENYDGDIINVDITNRIKVSDHDDNYQIEILDEEENEINYSPLETYEDKKYNVFNPSVDEYDNVIDNIIYSDGKTIRNNEGKLINSKLIVKKEDLNEILIDIGVLNDIKYYEKILKPDITKNIITEQNVICGHQYKYYTKIFNIVKYGKDKAANIKMNELNNVDIEYNNGILSLDYNTSFYKYNIFAGKHAAFTDQNNKTIIQIVDNLKDSFDDQNTIREDLRVPISTYTYSYFQTKKLNYMVHAKETFSKDNLYDTGFVYGLYIYNDRGVINEKIKYIPLSYSIKIRTNIEYNVYSNYDIFIKFKSSTNSFLKYNDARNITDSVLVKLQNKGIEWYNLYAYEPIIGDNENTYKYTKLKKEYIYQDRQMNFNKLFDTIIFHREGNYVVNNFVNEGTYRRNSNIRLKAVISEILNDDEKRFNLDRINEVFKAQYNSNTNVNGQQVQQSLRPIQVQNQYPLQGARRYVPSTTYLNKRQFGGSNKFVNESILSPKVIKSYDTITRDKSTKLFKNTKSYYPIIQEKTIVLNTQELNKSSLHINQLSLSAQVYIIYYKHLTETTNDNLLISFVCLYIKYLLIKENYDKLFIKDLIKFFDNKFQYHYSNINDKKEYTKAWYEETNEFKSMYKIDINRFINQLDFEHSLYDYVDLYYSLLFLSYSKFINLNDIIIKLKDSKLSLTKENYLNIYTFIFNEIKKSTLSYFDYEFINLITHFIVLLYESVISGKNIEVLLENQDIEITKLFKSIINKGVGNKQFKIIVLLFNNVRKTITV